MMDEQRLLHPFEFGERRNCMLSPVHHDNCQGTLGILEEKKCPSDDIKHMRICHDNANPMVINDCHFLVSIRSIRMSDVVVH